MTQHWLAPQQCFLDPVGPHGSFENQSECSEQVRVQSAKDWVWLCCVFWGLYGEICIPLFPSWIPRPGKRRKASRKSSDPAAQGLPLSHPKGKLRLSWGVFCTGISQMSSSLTVSIRHLEDLAGSPLNYPWCSRMLSGVLPFLPSLRASSFQCVTICTPWRDPHSWPRWGNYSFKL